MTNLRGTLGPDTILGTINNDLIEGLGGNDNLNGLAENDILLGGDGYDNLIGEDGNDTLDGGALGDWLYGGLGNDVLTGGSGTDRFVFGTTLNATSNVDTITDFTTGSDKIWLSASIFSKLTVNGALDNSILRIGTAAQDSTDHIIYNRDTGALIYDNNGSAEGGAIQFATIGKGLNLTANDFMVSGASVVTKIGTGSDTLVLKITQDAYLGAAQYAVFVDGKQVGGTFTASAVHNSGQSDTLEIKGDWGVGNHTVSVKLLNDLYGGSATADRNVYVESATYNGSVVTGSNQFVNSADTKSFTVADSTPVPSTTIPTPAPTPAPTPTSEVKPAPPASISIKDFGAVADGVTDNTYAIQQALNYASALGLDLYVPPGVFAHSGILQSKGVSILGAGDTSVLKATGAYYQAIKIGGNGVSIKNIALDAVGNFRSAGTAEDNKITVRDATNFEISGVTIKNSISAGILVLNSSNGWIHNNKVNSTGSDSIRLTNSSHTIRVEKNIIRESGDDGIAVLSFYGQVPTRNIEIVGNEIYDNLWGRNLAVIGGKDVKIINNLADGNKAGAAGVYIATENDYNTHGVENVLVQGNTILNTGGNGITTKIGQASMLAYKGTDRPMINIDFINNKVVPPSGVPATAIKGVAGTDAYFSDNTPTTTPLPIQVSQWSYTAPVGGTLPVTSGTLSGDTITASDTASDAVQGLDGDDKIYGRRGNDVLDGGSGNDLLDGGSDEDLIYGGYQGDVLYGGADADTFVLRMVQESPVAAKDTIGDFLTGVDKIDLRPVDAVSSVTGDQAFRFIGATAFSGRAGELRYADGMLSGDVNGDRVADLQIKFTNLPSMSASDILL